MEVIFGIPGGAIMPVYDVIFDSGIAHVLTRHEQGAIHAAEGYARTTGKVGVCMATSGPGATNLVTGLVDALMDSTPIVAITGQVSTHLIGTDGFQEADIYGISIPATKYNYLVRDANKLSQIIAEAFYIARTGRPGPVLIDIPKDIQNAMVEYVKPGPISLPCYNQYFEEIDEVQIDRAIEAIEAAERPVIYTGGGIIISGAHQELYELAKRTRIPVTNTLMGLGSFPGTDELSLGMLGMHGTKYANFAMDSADLIIALGARFDDRITGKVSEFAKHAKIVHVDIDAVEISKIIHAHIPIRGDVKRVLTLMLKKLEGIKLKIRDKWHQQIREWKTQHPLTYLNPEDYVMPQYVVEQIYEATKGEAIITVGVGQHQMWAAQYYRFQAPRHWVSSSGLGTMGFGFPAAIGAKVAYPNKTVFTIDGDGSFQMTIQELATAVDYHIPVKIAILNNRFLGMVRQWQQLFFKGRYSHTFLGSPDFTKIAEGYGAVGMLITKRDEVRPAIDKALEIDNTVVMDFRIPQEDNVYPMIPAGASLKQMIG
ncbi:MAG: biosynthetic-type acetolactate synthase large subunit [Nitrospira sp.]|nr:biosynthetic-type acetolactate synthase large subunit [Nitrospira sp.]